METVAKGNSLANSMCRCCTYNHRESYNQTRECERTSVPGPTEKEMPESKSLKPNGKAELKSCEIYDRK